MHKDLYFFNDQGIFRHIPDNLEIMETFFMLEWEKCLKIINETNIINNDFEHACLYLIAANCEIYLHNFARSLVYVEKAIEIEQLLDNKILKYYIRILLTRNFRLLKDYEQAEHFLSKIDIEFHLYQSYLIERCLLDAIKFDMQSLKINLKKLEILQNDIKFTGQLLSLKICLLACHNALAEYHKLSEILNDLEPLLVYQKNPYWKCLFFYYKSLDLFYKKLYEESISSIQSAVQEANQTNSVILKKTCAELSVNIYENLKDYKEAYGYHIKLSCLRTEYDNLITENRFIVLKHIFDKKQNKLRNQEILNKTTRLKSISLMNSALTYEIDAYLSNIKIDAESIIYWHKKNKDYLPSIFVEEIKMIIEAVDRTYQIINQMKTYWEYDNLEDNDIICINDIVKSVSKLLETKFKTNNIKLNLDLPEIELTIKANRLFIEQIFINLFNNSIKAFEKSTSQTKNIIIITRIEKQKIYLSFIDNATGLPEMSYQALFDPFITKTSNSQGMGLGLALVKNFLDRFSGFIKAYNNDIGGATFELSFPYAHRE